MTPTTHGTSLLAAILMLAAVTADGCSKRYAHKRLDKDSPEAGRVARMLSQLRDAGTDGIDGIIATQAVEGLNDAQALLLRHTLAELAAAEQVELEKADRFGQDVCRATFRLTTGGRSERVSILLVDAGAGDLRWFKKN